MTTYRIDRFYQDPSVPARVIAEGLSLEEAQAHCQDPETSSSTAHMAEAREEYDRYGPWFDGYDREQA